MNHLVQIIIGLPGEEIFMILHRNYLNFELIIFP
jgi:hypothetical protein